MWYCMWYVNIPVDKQRDFRRRRNTWKTVKNKYFIQNALCFANSQDKATNFATVISWIRRNAERAAGCVLILSVVSSPCFFGMTVVSPYIFCFYCGQLLIAKMRCRIICGYASWQVTSHRALGLPTLLRWSTCGLRVPGSKNTSLIGLWVWTVVLFFVLHPPHKTLAYECSYRCSDVSSTFWFVHAGHKKDLAQHVRLESI